MTIQVLLNLFFTFCAQYLSFLLYFLFKIINYILAQIHHEESTKLTGNDMKIRTIRCAIHLIHKGIKIGDCVGIIAKHTTNIGAVVFAALTIGASVNPLDSSFKINDIVHLFQMTKPKIVFCDFEKVDSVKVAVEKLGYDVIIVTIGVRSENYDFIDDYLVEDTEEEFFM